MHGIGKHGRVATDQVARSVDLRDAAIAALGDEMAEIFDGFRAAEQWLNRRMVLEVLEQLIGAAQRRVELTQQRPAADGERVLVGVDEHETGHAHRRIAEAFDGAALAGLAVEALFDESRLQLHDLLGRHRDLVWPQLPAQRLAVDRRLLEQPRAESDALAHHHNLCVEVVSATGRDADHPVVLDDEPVDHRLRHHHRAGLLRLLREPGIETCPQH